MSLRERLWENELLLSAHVSPFVFCCSKTQYCRRYFGYALVANSSVTLAVSWMAPEVVEKVGYNSKADIWSFGITALELAEGKGPYQSLTPLAAVKQLLKSPPPTLHDPKKWSKSFHTLISQCLEKDPSKRYPKSLCFPFLSLAQANCDQVVGSQVL